MSNSNEKRAKPIEKDKRNEVITDWKTYRSEKKRERKEWKEKKLLRILKRGQENKILVPESLCKPSNNNELDNSPVVPTISIAVPGAILNNAQSEELRTLLTGQIARAASICCVNEIIVYDETGSSTTADLNGSESPGLGVRTDPNVQMARILQYLECPQYLRKYFFPMHKDLKHAGLLPPLDSPHHLRESDESTFREGVVLERPVKEGHGSFVNVGLQKDVQLNDQLEAGLRVTVKLSDPFPKKKKLWGQAVSPDTPSKEEDLYWGYVVRIARSLGAVFAECPYQDGYDLTIGTSDKGESVDNIHELKPFRHLLVVFGGLKGLEYALECDELLPLEDPQFLFQHYLNAFPTQGSRTIRTEEAILLTMAALRPKIQASTFLPPRLGGTLVSIKCRLEGNLNRAKLSLEYKIVVNSLEGLSQDFFIINYQEGNYHFTEMAAKNEKIGIIGSGLIGRSWAMLFASAGYKVSLFDANPDQVLAALTDVQQQLQRHQERGVLRGQLDADQQFKLISAASSMKECMEDAKHVQEAVFESVEVKGSVFAEMDLLATEDQVLCSSTSCIDPKDFTQNMKHRSQVIVGHPTNPPYYVPMTEVVLSPWTTESILSRTKALLIEIGQSPVICKKVIPGFVSNRIQYSILNECWRLVEDGVISVEDIDTVMSDGLGMRYAFMGPLETAYLNADGMVDYCRRYASGIYRVSQTFGPPPKWEGPTVDLLERELSRKVPREKIQERRAWRDNCLIALARLRKEQGK